MSKTTAFGMPKCPNAQMPKCPNAQVLPLFVQSRKDRFLKIFSRIFGTLLAAFLLEVFCMTPSTGALADGEAPIALEIRGQEVKVEFHDLTEGIGAAFRIKVLNRLGEDFDLMIAKNSCSCLLIEGVEGCSFGGSEALEIIVKVRPTANQFSQKCTVTGRNRSGDRVEIVCGRRMA